MSEMVKREASIMRSTLSSSMFPPMKPNCRVLLAESKETFAVSREGAFPPPMFDSSLKLKEVVKLATSKPSVDVNAPGIDSY